MSRDPFGIKPLFYSYFNKNFYTASDISSLWELGIAKDVNPRQLGRLHLAWSARKDKTVWNAVNQVEPGTFLEIDLIVP